MKESELAIVVVKNTTERMVISAPIHWHATVIWMMMMIDRSNADLVAPSIMSPIFRVPVARLSGRHNIMLN